jgi:hypothetical protein
MVLLLSSIGAFPPYTLEGSAGEHEPQAIAKLVARMVPGKKN